jgi:hypothetical protein
MKKILYFLMFGLVFTSFQLVSVEAQVLPGDPCYDIAPDQRQGHPCQSASSSKGQPQAGGHPPMVGDPGYGQPQAGGHPPMVGDPGYGQPQAGGHPPMVGDPGYGQPR